MLMLRYLLVLRRRWVALTILTCVGALLASVYSLITKPVYQATTQFFVSMSTEPTDLTQVSQGGNFTQQRVRSYTDLITKPAVLQPVINELQMHTSWQDLGRSITAENPVDSVLINVTVSDSSPVRAAAIANSIGQHFPEFVDDLETPAGRVASAVRVSVSQRPYVPSMPVKPRKKLNLALGVLVGAGLGVVLALFLEAVDRRISSAAVAREIAGAPVLATIPEKRDVAGSGLAVTDPEAACAEPFRQLRTGLHYFETEGGPKSLVVTGAIRQDGRTYVTANLAVAIAQTGRDVVVVDADLRNPALSHAFSVRNEVGLTNVLSGETPLQAALQSWREGLPLRILPSGPRTSKPSELLASKRMTWLIQDLVSSGATVIIDSSPVVPVTDAAIVARSTDAVLLVVREGSTRTDQLASAVQYLRGVDATVSGVVLNRGPRKPLSGESASAERPANAVQEGSAGNRTEEHSDAPADQAQADELRGALRRALAINGVKPDGIDESRPGDSDTFIEAKA
jgi:capsular exopolysaccharide synthesis family protein